MHRFRELLRTKRKRARLTQEALAEKAGIDDSYVSKMEREDTTLPTRDIALELANALGMSNRPVTLYVSRKDNAALERFTFLLEAHVAGAGDVQAIRVIEVEDEVEGQEEEQAGSIPMPTTANPSIALPDSLLSTTGDQINEIKHLIDSLSLTDEEEEIVALQLDTTKQLLTFIAARRKARKDD